MNAGQSTGGWRPLVADETVGNRLVSLWGKSNADGEPLSLMQHLFDAMAVAELVWDKLLAPCLQDRLDAVTRGRGRSFYVWLCGLHDCGKASVAFQSKDETCWRSVRQSGLKGERLTSAERRSWRHEMATTRILLHTLGEHWGDNESVEWVWPVLAGHHGVFHGSDVLQRARGSKGRRVHGDDGWGAVQEAIVQVVTRLAGYPEIAEVEPDAPLSRPDQLALSGFVVVADWIASIENEFRGITDFATADLERARTRAGKAWAALGLRGGWRRLERPAADPAMRFKAIDALRPVQRSVIDAAWGITAPGLIIVEAPTGEGKTEAALAGAEVLASRFGADGIFVGLPTQATSDPMFDRVADWLATVDDRLPIALLHGRKIFHDRWRRLVDRSRHREDAGAENPETDVYGLVDELPSFAGLAEDHTGEPGELALTVIEWMLGRHRGLLSPNAVGTIDQLLYAGTRTRFVMLRYAGLAGKVVILDEIHAVDDYMAVYLGEVLEWLGQGNVPVILLSATLSPEQRQRLVNSYVHGALGRGYRTSEIGFEMPGYPAVLAACVADDEPRIGSSSTVSSRDSELFSVEIIDESEGDDATAAYEVAEILARELVQGGCALVVRNTVGRAQATYEAVRAAFGDEVVLLHSRLSAADRAERTQRLVERLGPDGARRPRWEDGQRLVVVATQVAEQSFDVDVDLLISDQVPIDLLVQRVGRMHRHRRPESARPPRLRQPRLIVTGAQRRGDRPPWFPGGSEAIYGRHLLLRSWVLVEEASTRGWLMPEATPELVARAYGTEAIDREGWAEDARAAQRKWDEICEARRRRAAELVLTPTGASRAVTLEGLNVMGSRARDVEAAVRVRDGDETEEVVLIASDEQGLWTLDGRRWLGRHGEVVHGHVDDDLVVAILGGTVRVPVDGHRRGALSGVGPLPEWRDHPVLGRQKVVSLDAGHRANLPGSRWSLGYDAALGLWMTEHR